MTSIKRTFSETINYYHQDLFHSLHCLHRHRSLAIIDHAEPRWRIRLSLHHVLGLPCRLVHSSGVHSVTPLVHTSKEPVCPRVELILKIIIILLIIFLGFIKSKPC